MACWTLMLRWEEMCVPRPQALRPESGSVIHINTPAFGRPIVRRTAAWTDREVSWDTVMNNLSDTVSLPLSFFIPHRLMQTGMCSYVLILTDCRCTWNIDFSSEYERDREGRSKCRRVRKYSSQWKSQYHGSLGPSGLSSQICAGHQSVTSDMVLFLYPTCTF